MPIYQYQCTNHTIERRQTYAEHDAEGHLILCPSCGEPVKQVYKPVPVFYRVPGWDYSPEGSAKGETVKEEICVSG